MFNILHQNLTLKTRKQVEAIEIVLKDPMLNKQVDHQVVHIIWNLAGARLVTHWCLCWIGKIIVSRIIFKGWNLWSVPPQFRNFYSNEVTGLPFSQFERLFKNLFKNLFKHWWRILLYPETFCSLINKLIYYFYSRELRFKD